MCIAPSTFITTDGTLTTPAGKTYLGNSQAKTEAFNGQIGEVIFFNTVLSDADRTVVQNYLTTKWI